MSGPSSDRNLLLGIVALQMDFISRDALIGAMHQWTLAKSTPLSDILVASGALDPADRAVLEILVERHIARHGGDPEKSLSSLEIVLPAGTTLEMFDDPDVKQSLNKLGAAHTIAAPGVDPDRTGSWGAIGQKSVGRYSILRLHDEGGIGSVFLATDGEVNREVALKQLKEEVASDHQSRARFIFEAEITGNLEHPGVVPVYGRGVQPDGRPYYAMRFVRGDNLKVAVDRFHKNPALKTDAAARQREFQKLLRRFLVVCETMAYVHSRGVLHRDLKPRNILLGPYGETLIVDWGLAKVVGRAEPAEASDATIRPPSSSDVQPTVAGSRVGTPAYMSPEQARGENDQLGPATDIYSLGATLYYVVTSKSPFMEEDIPAVLRKVERGEFLAPRQASPGVDRALDAICGKAMALKAEDRYPTAQRLADDLEHWLADQPVSAYPEPLIPRAARWVRRRKKLVATAAGLLAFAFLALILHDWSISAEKARTADQLVMTRKSLRELLNVSGVSLASVPNTEKLRETIANTALKSYRNLGERFPNDPGVRLETAQVHRLIGGVERTTGQFATSLAAYDQAIEILTKLSDEDPTSTVYKRWLTEAYKDRGALFLMNGKSREAERDSQMAILHAEGFFTTPLDPNYRRAKGAALINLSEVKLMKKEYEPASLAAHQAVELFKPLADVIEPADRTITDRWHMSLALTDRASVFKMTGQTANALRDFDAAEHYALLTLQDVPTNNDARYQRDITLIRKGELLALDPTTRDEALKCLNESIGDLELLIKDFNENTSYREGLAFGLSHRANVQLASRRLDLAAADASAARRRLEKLIEDESRSGPFENVEYVSSLGRTFEILSRITVAKGDAKAGRDHLVKAIEKLTRCVRIDPLRRVDEDLSAECKARLEKLAVGAPATPVEQRAPIQSPPAKDRQ